MVRDSAVLVTGAGGQVGTALHRLLPEARYVGKGELDVTDAAAVRDAVRGAAVVIHLAAMTAVDRCEVEPERALAVNGCGSRIVAAAASAAGARLIGLSSDYVFDGTKPGEYAENDVPRPLSVYGRSKLECERAVLRAERGLVIRTSWVYGDGHNFIRTIIDAGTAARELVVVGDQTGRPTSSTDLAKAILYLLPAAATGVVHVTGDGPPTTWAALAEFALAAAGIDAVVEHVSSYEYGRRVSTSLATRPANSVMSLDRARRLGVPLYDWRRSVSTYLQEVS